MKKGMERLKSLADNMRSQHSDIRVDNTYDFLHTSELFYDYLSLGFRQTGLNRTQVMILDFLLANGGTMTPTELKAIMPRSSNAISKSLDSLDKLGLTASSKPKQDRRQRMVSLTEKGLDLLEKTLPVRCDLFTQASICLSQADARALQHILNQLETHLLGILGRSSEASRK